MGLFFHPYVLRSRGGLNAVSQRREFHGALIRDGAGVGCLHPWPEFGDAPLAEQLDCLRGGGSSRVVGQALRMAAVDGAARQAGVSLFEGMSIPPCHYSWDHHQPMDGQKRRLAEEGWQAVKSKGWGSTAELLRWLEEFTGDDDVRTAPRLRLDFNSCLEEEQFADFVRAMPAQVRARLDFVEDPFHYDAARWEAARSGLGVRLALDKQLRGATRGFDVAVLKPGRREWRDLVPELPESTRLVMTSAMDHAIGQSFAAWEAACAWRECGERLDLCGLCTEHLFESEPFFERLSSRGGRLEVDRAGTGLGFDDLLEKLPWQAL